MDPVPNPSLVSVRYEPPNLSTQTKKGFSFEFLGFACRDSEEENPPLDLGVQASSLIENTNYSNVEDTTTTTTTITTTTTTTLFTNLHGPAQKIRKVNKFLNGLRPRCM